MTVDLERITILMDRMHALGIAELEYTHGDEHVRLVRDTSPPASPAPGTVPAATPDVPPSPLPAPAPTSCTITATMHGQFYASPTPGGAPFVTAGSVVAQEQPLYILEVMKTLTRVEAEFPCTIVAILCENGQAVEPGTELFTVERRDA
ncbi:acetyl-CoA carboxylase, biotin carboxyl carrier protein [Gluconacetobacter diazotrophicus PA1 5]|uniref:acetyl-CoA carboxylase biotin carboxyl carrier protein n=1 Tax=Gluconacetobacter diazotrophicus TaxID=33996 RepID=UPI000173C045|nr:biotin/lipoyl-containing protein [Gluconacetobacter diazotrophicus]ACI52026.1 acetyl-CoA carboxylase, biotin carboxyl carrier protein [Gluconacetobacter diazotrophicus PA1 5]